MQISEQGKPAETQIVVYSSPSAMSAKVGQVAGRSGFQVVKWAGEFTAITLADGRKGYVESRFLNLPIKILKLKQGQVPMYQSASAASRVKDTLPAGALVDCVGFEIEADNVKWIPIRSTYGQSGYIRADTAMAEPGRMHWLRSVSRNGLRNMWIGACVFVVGVCITLGTYLLAASSSHGGIIIFMYGLVFEGAIQFIVGFQQLRMAMEIERRKFRERFQ